MGIGKACFVLLSTFRLYLMRRADIGSYSWLNKKHFGRSVILERERAWRKGKYQTLVEREPRVVAGRFGQRQHPPSACAIEYELLHQRGRVFGEEPS
jgi:hypothetical protein